MVTLKNSEIRKMSQADRGKKLKELKLELMKSLTGTGKSKNTKQIKKLIARIYTINNSAEVPSRHKKLGGVLNK